MTNEITTTTPTAFRNDVEGLQFDMRGVKTDLRNLEQRVDSLERPEQ